MICKLKQSVGRFQQSAAALRVFAEESETETLLYQPLTVLASNG
ncbi:hypothetical protein STRDD11_01493 [Streptococcus sp. DD11]|nr:hypothetical protein STRDD11_01493 [Streptococcus sp. DD11]